MIGLHNEIAHWNFATIYKIISDRFLWLKICLNVALFVRNCESCQNVATSEKNNPYGKISFSGLFHTWLIDFAALLKEAAAGNKYIFFAVVIIH